MWYRKANINSKSNVSTCIVFRKNKNNTEVLLVKRANDPNKNKWCIPGGHIENEENPWMQQSEKSKKKQVLN